MLVSLHESWSSPNHWHFTTVGRDAAAPGLNLRQIPEQAGLLAQKTRKR